MFITAMASFAFANLNPTNYLGSVSFRPERDIPDLGGKVVLVTGGEYLPNEASVRNSLELLIDEKNRKRWSGQGDHSPALTA
jgi:hypothetical protein